MHIHIQLTLIYSLSCCYSSYIPTDPYIFSCQHDEQRLNVATMRKHGQPVLIAVVACPLVSTPNATRPCSIANTVRRCSMQGIPTAILRRLQSKIPSKLPAPMIYHAGILKCGELTYIRRYCHKYNYIVDRISPGRFRITPSPIPLTDTPNLHIQPCRR